MSNKYFKFEVTWKNKKKKDVFRFTNERLYLSAYNKYASNKDVVSVKEIKD